MGEYVSEHDVWKEAFGGRKIRRSLGQVFEDGLWPALGIGPADPMEGQRFLALAVVLLTLPQDDYNKLRKEFEEADLSFYIPHPATYGEIRPEEQFVYFSPLLERVAFSRVLAVVAHELAHIVLGHHRKLAVTPEEEKKREEEAWALVRKWGFEREARIHLAQRKRRETMEQREKWVGCSFKF